MIKIKKKRYSENEFYKNEYDIFYKNELVGCLEYKKRNNIFFILDLYIFLPYRKKGIGKKVVLYIYENYKFEYIIGEVLEGALGFWQNINRELNGYGIYCAYSSNCINSFVIPKKKESRYMVNKKFNKDNMFCLLEEFYNE